MSEEWKKYSEDEEGEDEDLEEGEDEEWWPTKVYYGLVKSQNLTDSISVKGCERSQK